MTTYYCLSFSESWFLHLENGEDLLFFFLNVFTICCMGHIKWGIILFFFFCLFRAASRAYGGSQARGWIWSLSNQPTPQPQQCQIWAAFATYTTAHSDTGSPLSEARNRTCILMVASQVRYHWATMGIPVSLFKRTSLMSVCHVLGLSMASSQHGPL